MNSALPQDIIRDVNVSQNLSKPPAKFFLAHAGQIALIFAAGAMVVDLLLLPNFGGDHAVIVSAIEQAGEGKNHACDIWIGRGLPKLPALV